MAQAQTTEVFNCTPEEFYKIISDYEKYHEFLKEIKSCKVIKTDGAKKLVEYHVSVVKTFKYQLWMTETPEKEIHWNLAGGDVFKTSTGFWKIEPTGSGQTKAHYSVEATFSMFVPGPVANALVSVNLPGMMAAYKNRIKQVYGK